MSTSPTDTPSPIPNEDDLGTQILNALIGHIKQTISLGNKQGYIRPIAVIDSSKPSMPIQLAPAEEQWIKFPSQIQYWAYCIASYSLANCLYGQVPDKHIYHGMSFNDLIQTLYPEGCSELQKSGVNQCLKDLESAEDLTVHDGQISLSRKAINRDLSLLMIQSDPVYKDINPERENLMQATKQLILKSIVQKARQIYDIPDGDTLEFEPAQVYDECDTGSLTLTFADASSRTCSPRGRSYVVVNVGYSKQFAGFYKNGLLDLLPKDGYQLLTNLAKTCIKDSLLSIILLSLLPP